LQPGIPRDDVELLEKKANRLKDTKAKTGRSMETTVAS
jgi:hypothetical protein